MICVVYIHTYIHTYIHPVHTTHATHHRPGALRRAGGHPNSAMKLGASRANSPVYLHACMHVCAVSSDTCVTYICDVCDMCDHTCHTSCATIGAAGRWSVCGHSYGTYAPSDAPTSCATIAHSTTRMDEVDDGRRRSHLPCRTANQPTSHVRARE
jgi:hypothetical protein